MEICLVVFSTCISTNTEQIIHYKIYLSRIMLDERIYFIYCYSIIMLERVNKSYIYNSFYLNIFILILCHPNNLIDFILFYLLFCRKCFYQEFVIGKKNSIFTFLFQKCIFKHYTVDQVFVGKRIYFNSLVNAIIIIKVLNLPNMQLL